MPPHVSMNLDSFNVGHHTGLFACIERETDRSIEPGNEVCICETYL